MWLPPVKFLKLIVTCSQSLWSLSFRTVGSATSGPFICRQLHCSFSALIPVLRAGAHVGGTAGHIRPSGAGFSFSTHSSSPDGRSLPSPLCLFFSFAFQVIGEWHRLAMPNHTPSSHIGSLYLRQALPTWSIVLVSL